MINVNNKIVTSIERRQNEDQVNSLYIKWNKKLKLYVTGEEGSNKE